MHATTTTDWRLLEIEDPKAPEEPFVLAVKIRKKEARQGSDIIEAEIEVKAYAVAGAVGRESFHHHIATMGGRFRPHPYEAFWLTAGDMMVEPDARGLRIGTYLQNEVISWAKALKQPGPIRRITLVDGDARTLDARDRRNRFYEQFGITFVWSDPAGGLERAAGVSTPGLSVDQLSTLDVVSGVRPFELRAGLRHYISQGRAAEISSREADRQRVASAKHYEQELHGQERLARAMGWVAGIALTLVLALAVVGVRTLVPN